MNDDWWPAGILVALGVWVLVQAVDGLTWSGWLVAAAVVLGQTALCLRLRARRPVGAWRPWPYWAGRLSATTVVITAIAVALGAPHGPDAVALGLTGGPVVTVLAFALAPRVGPPWIGAAIRAVIGGAAGVPGDRRP